MRNINQALLIDAENIGWHLAPLLLDAALQFGPCTVRRMYGNFNGQILQDWQTFAVANGFTTRHTPIVAGVKNSSDIALVIDAMDLLYQGQVGAFCIASSDCDFTGLVIRIREVGLPIHVFGEGKATPALRRAATTFTDLAAKEQEGSSSKPTNKQRAATKAQSQANSTPDPKKPPNPQTANTELTAEQKERAIDLISRAIKNRHSNDIGISIGVLGHELRRLDKNFKSSTFGCRTLTKLLEALKVFGPIHTADGVALVRLPRA